MQLTRSPPCSFPDTEVPALTRLSQVMESDPGQRNRTGKSRPKSEPLLQGLSPLPCQAVFRDPRVCRRGGLFIEEGATHERSHDADGSSPLPSVARERWSIPTPLTGHAGGPTRATFATTSPPTTRSSARRRNPAGLKAAIHTLGNEVSRRGGQSWRRHGFRPERWPTPLTSSADLHGLGPARDTGRGLSEPRAGWGRRRRRRSPSHPRAAWWRHRP